MASEEKRGRPEITNGTRKDVTVRVRMSPSQRKALEIAAGTERKSMSEFMRDLLQQWLDRA